MRPPRNPLLVAQTTVLGGPGIVGLRGQVAQAVQAIFYTSIPNAGALPKFSTLLWGLRFKIVL